MQKYIILIIVFLIVILGIYIISNTEIETEYVPEVEIKENDLRNTIISLFYKNKETGVLTKENRIIDSKELLKNPYKVLVEKLMMGTESEKNENIIPEGTKIIDIKFEKGVVFINFSKEFYEGVEKERLKLCCESIYLTLTNLAEVEDIKILIEGEEKEI